MNKIIKVAILGCTGYTGIELVNILKQHPNVCITFLGTQSNVGKSINQFDNRLQNAKLPKLELNNNINFIEIDLVFLALPHHASQKFIKDNFGKSIFIDLSADFRLNNAEIYKANYNINHSCPNLLKEFVYGLPEIYYSQIINSKNIAIPGCYPTSILLPLVPLIKNDLIISDNIIIDSKSGYSGAGKSFDISKLIKNNDNFNFYNYKTNNHRHICEIHQELKKFTKSLVRFSFNPHILPIFRGMMSTIYCELKEGINRNNLLSTYKKEYSENKFIKILKDDDNADFFSVSNTNNCLIKLYNHTDKNKIIIVSLIDNLLKGASGQAVQCMNLKFGLIENAGLT